jgi:hypothetical protein
VHTWYSDSGGDLQDPQPHKVFSPHSREGFVQEPVYVRSCGPEEGSLQLLLPTPVRSLYTQVTAQKAYKAQEVNQGVEQTPSVPDGGGVLATEREERGIGRWCSGGLEGMV